MRRLLRRWSGLSLLAALLVPLGAVFYFGVSDAQTRPGGIPIPRPMPFPPRTTIPPPILPPGTTIPPGTTVPPGTTFPPPGITLPPGATIPPGTTIPPGGFSPPRLERKWVCTGCRNTLGTGDFPPSVCPHCGARIINGFDGVSTTPAGMGPGFTPTGGLTPSGTGPGMPMPTTPITTPVMTPATTPMPAVTSPDPSAVMPMAPARTAPAPAAVTDSSDGIGGGAIAAIVIGALALIGLLLAGVKVLNS